MSLPGAASCQAQHRPAAGGSPAASPGFARTPPPQPAQHRAGMPGTSTRFSRRRLPGVAGWRGREHRSHAWKTVAVLALAFFPNFCPNIYGEVAPGTAALGTVLSRRSRATVGCRRDGGVLPSLLPPCRWAPREGDGLSAEHRASLDARIQRRCPRSAGITPAETGPTHGRGSASPRPLANRVAPGDK